MPRMPLPGRWRKGLSVAVPTLAALVLPAGASAAELKVVASFKPLHSLVAAIMQGAGQPSLLVKGAASPHSYALKPSDARSLESADVVFWLGEGMELFLVKPLAALPAHARVVELGDTPGLVLLKPRAGGVWEAHRHDVDETAAADDHGAAAGGDHDADPHAAYDSHLWLDPENARRLVAPIVQTLSEADPDHAALYAANGAALDRRLRDLDRELASALAPAKDVPFIVFHDAYQYLEARYGLTGVGSITVSPEQPPGAKRLQEIRRKVEDQQARCVFREPNFAPTLVDNMISGTAARTGVLDPEGAGLTEGPDLYFALMRGLAQSLRLCLVAGR